MWYSTTIQLERFPKILKTYFMDAFKTALQETRYTFPKDSTSAITIKVVNKNKLY